MPATFNTVMRVGAKVVQAAFFRGQDVIGAGPRLAAMGFTTLLNARTNTIHPSVTASRAGPGMVQNEAGEWVWAPHNLATMNVATFNQGTGVYIPVPCLDGIWKFTSPAPTSDSITGAVGGNSGWNAKGGQIFSLKVDVRCASSHGILTVFHECTDGATFWDRVGAAIAVPTDGEWHTIELHTNPLTLGTVRASWNWRITLPAIGVEVTVELRNPLSCRGGQLFNIPAQAAPYFAPRRTYDPATGEYGFMAYGQTTNLYRYGSTNSVDNISVTAQSYTVSMVGAGSVVLSGAHSATLTGTGGNNRVSLTFTPTAGTLVITPSGGAQFVQLETGTIATPPIPTYSAQATCAADVWSWNNQILTDAGGTVVARMQGAPTQVPSRAVLSGDPTCEPLAIQYGGYISSWDGVNSTQASAVDYFSATNTAVSSWGSGKTMLASSGAEVVTAYDGSIVGSTIAIGNNNATSNPLQGTINHLSVAPAQRSADERAQLAAITRF